MRHNIRSWLYSNKNIQKSLLLEHREEVVDLQRSILGKICAVDSILNHALSKPEPNWISCRLFHLHTWLWETLAWSAWQQQDQGGHTTLEVSRQDHPRTQSGVQNISNLWSLPCVETWRARHGPLLRCATLSPHSSTTPLVKRFKFLPPNCATCTLLRTLPPGGRSVGWWPCQASWSLPLGEPSSHFSYWSSTSDSPTTWDG